MDINQLANALLRGEQKRSEPFMQGMTAVLRNRIDQTLVTSPYQAGTIEADAFEHGRLRGHNEFRNALIEADNNRFQAILRLQQLAQSSTQEAA